MEGPIPVRTSHAPKQSPKLLSPRERHERTSPPNDYPNPPKCPGRKRCPAAIASRSTSPGSSHGASQHSTKRDLHHSRTTLDDSKALRGKCRISCVTPQGIAIAISSNQLQNQYRRSRMAPSPYIFDSPDAMGTQHDP